MCVGLTCECVFFRYSTTLKPRSNQYQTIFAGGMYNALVSFIKIYRTLSRKLLFLDTACNFLINSLPGFTNYVISVRLFYLGCYWTLLGTEKCFACFLLQYKMQYWLKIKAKTGSKTIVLVQNMICYQYNNICTIKTPS